MASSWQNRLLCRDKVQEISRKYDLHPIATKCLLSRLKTTSSDEEDEKEIQSILGELEYQPADPFLLNDMHEAVERILLAIKRNEKICVFGDYDADGVTAIAILTRAIKALGGNTYYYIPDRFSEGIGLAEDCLDEIVMEHRADLIVTVDCGCRNVAEVEYAKSRNLDVIITDHHIPGDVLPDALAVINPKRQDSNYPFGDLCGAGVAYKVVEALAKRFPRRFDLANYQKIAAIGTIADMVPLRAENRWLVQQGLKAISSDTKGPIRTLLRKVGIRNQVYAHDISYKIAPRINAPGRLGDPATAISFFLKKNNCFEVNKLVDIMDGMNYIRQMLERELESRLVHQIRALSRKQLPPFILLAGKNWHRGILGITACKMLRKFSRPVCVLSYDSKEANGSLRGVPGVNLIDALNEIRSLFTSFGGHAEAAGVSLDLTNLPQFKQRMNELLEPHVHQLDVQPVSEIDAELEWSDINRALFDDLMKLEPFGSGNATPVFVSRNLILETDIQRNGPWLSFTASDGLVKHKCSFYHPDELEFEFERYDSLDLMYSISPFRDDFQIQIIEMKPS
ncbi:MAG: single-stranded-DNA-specific exonuclease RecJ [Acidobacteria bacterium]|nr:MAG: single-stranded-DNA-specific exonuclease RecJ [Acidobacteriota bacterium]